MGDSRGAEGGLIFHRKITFETNFCSFFDHKMACALRQPPLEPPLCMRKKSYGHFLKILSEILRGAARGGSQAQKTDFPSKNEHIRQLKCQIGAPPANNCHIRIFWTKPSLKHIYNFFWKCIDFALQQHSRETNQIPDYESLKNTSDRCPALYPPRPRRVYKIDFGEIWIWLKIKNMSMKFIYF